MRPEGPTHTGKVAIMVKLLSIDNQNRPVRVRALGQRGQGLVWTVQPENVDKTLVDMINDFGGPDMWEITVL